MANLQQHGIFPFDFPFAHFGQACQMGTADIFAIAEDAEFLGCHKNIWEALGQCPQSFLEFPIGFCVQRIAIQIMGHKLHGKHLFQKKIVLLEEGIITYKRGREEDIKHALNTVRANANGKLASILVTAASLANFHLDRIAAQSMANLVGSFCRTTRCLHDFLTYSSPSAAVPSSLG
jgi:hypothetical protein